MIVGLTFVAVAVGRMSAVVAVGPTAVAVAVGRRSAMVAVGSTLSGPDEAQAMAATSIKVDSPTTTVQPRAVLIQSVNEYVRNAPRSAQARGFAT